MSHGSTMLVLTRPGDREAAARERVGALIRQIPIRPLPKLEWSPIETFVPGPSIAADIVLLLESAASAHPAERAIIEACEEADVAVVRVPANSAADTNLAIRLDVLLERQRTIKRLHLDLAVAQRFQGGLRGEISRIHEEMQLAAMVQQEFLPRSLPDLHGLSFAALWKPANYVSGDIYDVTRLDEDHVGVFIADAVGHGVPAALMTMVIARALSAKDVANGTYRIVPPGEVLSRLNTEMIRRQGETTRFATAVYAVIDCRTRTLRLAGAGHPAPLLWREGQPLKPLETQGGLLGVFDGESFDEIVLDLQLNDRLFFYSDGFEVAFPTEGPDDRSMKMPTKKFITEFERLGLMETPRDMIEAIARRIDDQPGSLHQNDDLTLLCVKAGALAPRTASTPARDAQPAAA